MTAQAGKDMEQGEHPSKAGRNTNLDSLFENQYGIISENSLLTIPCPRHTTPEVTPTGYSSYDMDACSTMFIVTLLIAARNCIKPRLSLTNRLRTCNIFTHWSITQYLRTYK